MQTDQRAISNQNTGAPLSGSPPVSSCRPPQFPFYASTKRLDIPVAGAVFFDLLGLAFGPDLEQILLNEARMRS
jgi:hypothetical protein